MLKLLNSTFMQLIHLVKTLLIVSPIKKTLNFLGYRLLRTNDFRLMDSLFSDVDLILRNSKGVLHIGAHVGEEREQYTKLNIPVLWIEANPKQFERLKENISKYRNQTAKLLLLGSKNLKQLPFYLTNNLACSSIYPLAQEHGFKQLKTLHVVNQIRLDMHRLDQAILEDEILRYDYWVIDVQGGELEVLKGSQKYLKYCRFLEIEVSTEIIYQNQPLFSDIAGFLEVNGFYPAFKPNVNFHGNILFLKLSTN